jgi:hypothetical protein
MSNAPFYITSIIALLIALIPYTRSKLKGDNPAKSLLVATITWAICTAAGNPLVDYLLHEPDRALADKRTAIAAMADKMPEYQAFKNYDNDHYQTLLTSFALGENSKNLPIASPEWKKLFIDTAYNHLGGVRDLMKYATDEAVIHYVDLRIEELGILQDEASGEACAAYLRGEYIDPNQYFADELINDHALAAAEIIRTAKQSANTNFSKPSQQLWHEATTTLMQEYGSDWWIINDTFNKTVDKPKLCAVNQRFLRLLRELPAQDSSQALRAWLKFP